MVLEHCYWYRWIFWFQLLIITVIYCYRLSFNDIKLPRYEWLFCLWQEKCILCMFLLWKYHLKLNHGFLIRLICNLALVGDYDYRFSMIALRKSTLWLNKTLFASWVSLCITNINHVHVIRRSYSLFRRVL